MTIYTAVLLDKVPTFERVIGWALACALLLLLIANGAVMVLSPRRWFELPIWIASVRGRLTPAKYSQGLGGFQVRMLGAALLGVVAWVCVGVLSR